MEDLYLVESFFWRDNWINEDPYSMRYGTLSECLNHLEKAKDENYKYEPVLNLDKMELTYSSDNRRHYLLRIVKITPLVEVSRYHDL
jgi:hypothetical protein